VDVPYNARRGPGAVRGLFVVATASGEGPTAFKDKASTDGMKKKYGNNRQSQRVNATWCVISAIGTFRI
jgi:hypothetical protein